MLEFPTLAKTSETDPVKHVDAGNGKTVCGLQASHRLGTLGEPYRHGHLVVTCNDACLNVVSRNMEQEAIARHKRHRTR